MNRPELQAMAEHELKCQQKFRLQFLYCAGPPCLYSGATAVLEALRVAKMHKNIANERLKRDYRPLREAKIKVEEKYF